MLSSEFKKDFYTKLGYIPSTSSAICLLSEEDLESSLLAVSGLLSKNTRGKAILITFNRTYKSIEKSFVENSINKRKFTVIACNNTEKNSTKTENCIILKDPSSLNELSMTLTDLAHRHRYRYIIFDSVNALLYYNKDSGARNFFQSLVEFLREYHISGIFFATEDRLTRNIIDFVADSCEIKIRITRHIAVERFAEAFG